MAIHSSTIAWKIPWTEEPGRLQFMGSQRVGHDWATQPTYIAQCFRLRLPKLDAEMRNNAMTKLDSILKSRDITLPTKVCLVKAMVFPIVMYGCESWSIKKAELKNWCFWTVMLEKTLESPLDYKEIQPVSPKGNQSWIFIGSTEVEAETPILCPSGAKNGHIGKDPYAGKDWRQEEKGTTED